VCTLSTIYNNNNNKQTRRRKRGKTKSDSSEKYYFYFNGLRPEEIFTDMKETSGECAPAYSTLTKW